MQLHEPTIAMEFNETTFGIAVGQLEIDPEDATIWVPAAQIARAYLIQKKYNCKLIAIPNVLTKSSFCWAVGSDKGALYWSNPNILI